MQLAPLLQCLKQKKNQQSVDCEWRNRIVKRKFCCMTDGALENATCGGEERFVNWKVAFALQANVSIRNK